MMPFSHELDACPERTAPYHRPWGFAGSNPLSDGPAAPASCSTAASNKSSTDKPSQPSAIGCARSQKACVASPSTCACFAKASSARACMTSLVRVLVVSYCCIPATTQTSLPHGWPMEKEFGVFPTIGAPQCRARKTPDYKHAATMMVSSSTERSTADISQVMRARVSGQAIACTRAMLETWIQRRTAPDDSSGSMSLPTYPYVFIQISICECGYL
ncbi:hypothetical protein QBC34DRAFT_69293 [Podospora aff. communis PSN243]|uniref:Uncharacterized protein n=1 Tax=Podospora aff. communis PSN243 TaxID=3040156 RepID=A0AAV9H638_9PEZI|nr:hypothetical protein QBC34DRAFT_69293 [Podospora aff. communis PSN243]